MLPHPLRVSVGLLLSALLATACTQGTPSSENSLSENPTSNLITPPPELDYGDARLATLAERIPGFASLRWDAVQREAVVGIRGSVAPDQAGLHDALADALGREVPNVRVEIHSGGWSIQELLPYRMKSEVLGSSPSVLTRDLDESIPILRFGIGAGTDTIALNRVLDSAGIPRSAWEWQVVEPTVPLATVRDRNRAHIENGFQIEADWGGGTHAMCTSGADIIASGPTPGFITNAHCGAGGVGMFAGTPIYQNIVGFPPTYRVGTESLNPPLFSGGVCPAGKQCRYSDAMFVAYTPSGFYAGKKIAETTSIGTVSPGSITVARYRLAPLSANLVTGMTVRKTGRTSGTTQGVVSATCVHITSATTGIEFRCQDQVGAYSFGGDSGSPVYYTEDFSDLNASVYHVGILWGGNGSLFTLSPWTGITTDLGLFY